MKGVSLAETVSSGTSWFTRNPFQGSTAYFAVIAKSFPLVQNQRFIYSVLPNLPGCHAVDPGKVCSWSDVVPCHEGVTKGTLESSVQTDHHFALVIVLHSWSFTAKS